MNSEHSTLTSVHKKPKKPSNNQKRRSRIRYAAHHGIEVKSDATLAQDFRQERDDLVKKVELLTAEDQRVRKECVDVNDITRQERDALRADADKWKGKCQTLKKKLEQFERNDRDGVTTTLEEDLKKEERYNEQLVGENKKWVRKYDDKAADFAQLEISFNKNRNDLDTAVKKRVDAESRNKSLEGCNQGLVIERDMYQYHTIVLYECANEFKACADLAARSVKGLSDANLTCPDFRAKRKKNLLELYKQE